MKSLQRYLSLLSALVLCVGLFSVTAHAEEVKPYHISMSSSANGETLGKTIIVYPFDDVVTSSGDYYSTTADHQTVTTYLNLSIATDDGSCLIDKGHGAEVKFENGFWWYRVLETDYDHLQEVYSIKLETVSGEIYTIEDYTLTHKNGHLFDLNFNIGAIDEDIRKIHIVMRVQQSIWSYGSHVYSIFGEMEEYQYTAFKMSVDIETKEESLLGGILGWIQNLFDAIVNLPANIWAFFEDGLVGLFVPSEDALVEYMDKWDELFSSRFGAVYDVVHVMTDSWGGIMNADETNTVAFPSATINFSGTPFTFGGYDVKIVPEGFEWLATSVKLIVGIACTVLFVNGMRKRYDELMGVEQ